MGVAHEHRAAMHFRAQFEADGVAHRRRVDADGAPINWREFVEASNANVRMAEARLSRAMLRFRERSATLSAERIQWSAERESLLRRARSAECAMLRYRRKWEFVSRMVRALLTPSQVRDYRSNP